VPKYDGSIAFYTPSNGGAIHE